MGANFAPMFEEFMDEMDYMDDMDNVEQSKLCAAATTHTKRTHNGRNLLQRSMGSMFPDFAGNFQMKGVPQERSEGFAVPNRCYSWRCSMSSGSAGVSSSLRSRKHFNSLGDSTLAYSSAA